LNRTTDSSLLIHPGFNKFFNAARVAPPSGAAKIPFVLPIEFVLSKISSSLTAIAVPLLSLIVRKN